MQPIILASASLRRAELLKRLGMEFTIVPSRFDETLIQNPDPRVRAEKLALAKAQDVASQYPDALVIGADTIVSLNGEQFGKPGDALEAVLMLQKLRGKSHEVMTGIAVINSATRNVQTTVDIARVTMRDYSDDEIEAYIATGEPLDKAGAYAIQGKGSVLVDSYEGDIETIIGLPTRLLKKILLPTSSL